MSVVESLNKFKVTSLDELKSVSLMDRVDTKFAFEASKLNQLLVELSQLYNVLEVNGSKIQPYRSLYYDTPGRFFFLEHHNQRTNRNKVRFREYVESGLVFLEVKLKNNKGKTIKKRMQVDAIPDSLLLEHKNYIKSIVGQDLNLTSQHWINFNRLTFVDKLKTERVTIDLDLKFSNNVKSGSFDTVVIAEVKRERSRNSSKFSRLAKKLHILPIRLSKYCMSTIDLNPDVKRNRFKEKLLLINKLKQL